MKIGTQLIIGAIAIGTIVTVNAGVIFLRSEEAEARRINLSGVVRGGTQRAVKLELVAKPNPELIARIDNLIAGLIDGSDELNLPPAKDKILLDNMQEVQAQWNRVKNILTQVRTNPTDSNRELLLVESSCFEESRVL